MRSYLVLAIFLCWFSSGTMPASAQAGMIICQQSKGKMPSREQHRAFLATNPRYGPEMAEQFYRRYKPFGDDYLRFQIHYFPEHPGASGWFDVNGETGLAESNSVTIKEWSCKIDKDYPVLLMIGIEPRSIRNGTLYVARRENTATILSLSQLAKADRPVPMRLDNSGRLVCPDVRAAVFWDERRKCTDVSSFIGP
jgi:hypothetical protein